MDISGLISILPNEVRDTVTTPGAKLNSPQNLEQACESFEALFTSQLLSGMAKSTIITEGSDGAGANTQEKWLWSLLIQNLSQDIAKNHSLGLGKLLGEELKARMKPGGL